MTDNTANNSNSKKQNSGKKSSTINMKAKAFLGEIRQAGGGDKPVAYYIDANLLAGEDDKGKARYLRMSLRVKKTLVPAIELAYSNQILAEGKPPQHTLSGVMMSIDIYGPFFSPWFTENSSGVNGEGVLMAYAV